MTKKRPILILYKLILHMAEASRSGAKSVLIYSPDTDVLVLAVYHYPRLCANTVFVTRNGTAKMIRIRDIYEALGDDKVSALLGLHAPSGCDNTGSFAGKAKISFWKAFRDASEECIRGLSKLGIISDVDTETLSSIERFVFHIQVSQRSTS